MAEHLLWHIINVMLIDAHQHVGYLKHSSHAVIHEMDALGIDMAWILTWHLPPDEDAPGYHHGTDPRYARPDGSHAAMPLSGVLEACKAYPDRFIAGYCPPPTCGDAAAQFEIAHRMHGVRICGEWSYRTPLDDPRAVKLFRKAGELGCPVVLHMDVPWRPGEGGGVIYDPSWYAGTLDSLDRALAACPRTIIVGHAPGFWRYLSTDADTNPALRPTGPVMPGGRVIELLEKYPNLYADLSAGSGLVAMTRDKAHARTFITRYADRLLFGRDQYGDALHKFLLGLDLPDDVLAKVFHENARRLVPCS